MFPGNAPKSVKVLNPPLVLSALLCDLQCVSSAQWENPRGCALHMALLSTSRQTAVVPIKCFRISVTEITSGYGASCGRSGWATACPLCLNQRRNRSPQTSQAGFLLRVQLKDWVKMLCDLVERQDQKEPCIWCFKWKNWKKNPKMTSGQENILQEDCDTQPSWISISRLQEERASLKHVQGCLSW